MKITGLEIVDLRFPTSLTSDGTDAVHKDPDYSAAYVILHTDGGLEGHGFTFTIGRGNEVCAEAIRAFTPLVVGRDVDEIFAAPAAFWRSLAGDSQLRWLGPEKGVIHISMAAIVNAMWDLHAKQAGKPLWKLLADMTPRQIVASIDFQYITDALTEDEALAILERQHVDEARARADPPARRLPRLHHVRRLDGLLRRQGAPPLPRSDRRRVHALQGQGRRRSGRRCAARRDGPAGDRSRPPPDDRREPAMGRRRGDRARPRALAVQPPVDRGADQPGRRARACGDRARRGADRRRHRRALREPRALQAAAPGARRSPSARSTAAASAA